MAESNNDSERWRTKYFDHLEEVERRENEWQQIEGMLRQGLLRLSLAAQPGDQAFERSLKDLRAGLGRGISSANLSDCLEAISAGVARMEMAHDDAPTREPPEETARQLLAQIIQKALLPHAQQEAKLLLGRVASSSNAAELSRASDDLAAALNALHVELSLPLHSVLVQLLEYLPIPSELNDEVEGLKALLANPLDESEVDATLLRMAALVSEVRRHALREKADWEGFLRQLTENLKELDQNLDLIVFDHRESVDEKRRYGSSMDAQMDDLAESVRTANELESLKHTVQERVTTIRSHMIAFREIEEQRSARAEQSVVMLTQRLGELESEATILRERIRQERNNALIDPLTGINNRLAYEERLEQEYQRWKRYRTPLSIAVWDVDFFKRINDRYGHQAGDKVLKVMGKLLSAQVRTTDFLCRYGGEEFVILLPETSVKSALSLAEKLRASVEAAEFHYRGEQVKITISCGIAEFRGEDVPDDVFSRADKALYRAKEQGRNNCCSE